MAGMAFRPDAFLYTALLVFLILLFIPKGRRFIRSLGFRHQDNWLKTIAIAAAGYAAVLGAQTIAAAILPEIFNPDDPGYYADLVGNTALYVFSLISGVVIGGFVEEMIFRGFLLTRLIKIYGKSNRAILSIVAVTSLAFGLMHISQSLGSAIATGIFSLIASLIFVKTRCNLWLIILMHSVNNIVTFTVLYLGLA